ncbi:MAG: sporulation protein YabP [Oscillospiraceae bacterium]|nr:sporulation protein YabP [Oscillospiraceae bacterium]
MQKPHHLILDGRERLLISGVADVESFDENGVVCKTTQGTLLVRGSGLRVDKLSLEGGELSVEGKIDSLAYEDSEQAGGFWSRLFR